MYWSDYVADGLIEETLAARRAEAARARLGDAARRRPPRRAAVTRPLERLGLALMRAGSRLTGRRSRLGPRAAIG